MRADTFIKGGGGGLAKGMNQKKKLIFILQLLQRESDENHPVSMQRILDYLEVNGIAAERKSVYDDIRVLEELGYDVICQKKEPQGYYLGERAFELAELKLLVDAVQSSKFLSVRKSGALIKKLEQFCSRHEAKQLQREVYVYDRVKSMNESIYYNVDKIHTAMGTNRMISFQYMEWGPEKRLVPRRNGKQYRVSPYSLAWAEENYYLVAYDEESGERRHYRVDKMDRIQLLEEERTHREQFVERTAAVLSKKAFGMFDGAEERVKLLVQKQLLGVVLDRFGTDIALRQREDGWYEAGVDVLVSRQFYGWLFGVGGMKVLAPEYVAEEYRRLVKEQAEWLSEKE